MKRRKFEIESAQLAKSNVERNLVFCHACVVSEGPLNRKADRVRIFRLLIKSRQNGNFNSAFVDVLTCEPLYHNMVMVYAKKKDMLIVLS